MDIDVLYYEIIAMDWSSHNFLVLVACNGKDKVLIFHVAPKSPQANVKIAKPM